VPESESKFFERIRPSQKFESVSFDRVMEAHELGHVDAMRALVIGHGEPSRALIKTHVRRVASGEYVET
jgi:hypothetical protein